MNRGEPNRLRNHGKEHPIIKTARGGVERSTHRGVCDLNVSHNVEESGNVQWKGLSEKENRSIGYIICFLE